MSPFSPPPRTKSNATLLREAWEGAEAARVARDERRLMPSLVEPIHPLACECRECRHVYGPRR